MFTSDTTLDIAAPLARVRTANHHGVRLPRLVRQDADFDSKQTT